MAESTVTLSLANERATTAFAASLWPSLARATRAAGAGMLVELAGPLGAGKTTFVRGLLRAAGVHGPVTSPTYTLIEPYSVDDLALYHVDLYRLSGAADLAALGIEELRHALALALVEWPERLGGALGSASLTIELAYEGAARRVTVIAGDQAGQEVLAALATGFSQEAT